MSNVADAEVVLDFISRHHDSVDGWTVSYEYPGIWMWKNPELPNGMLCATPFWGGEDVQIEWQTYDGDVFPMEGFEYHLTDSLAADAETYVNGLRPFLKRAAETF